MGIAAYNVLPAGPVGWSGHWAWGIPLVVLTVLLRVSGLGLIL
jgi:hypothetical protein